MRTIDSMSCSLCPASPETSNHRTRTGAVPWRSWQPDGAAYESAGPTSTQRRRTTDQIGQAWARYRCAERDMAGTGMVGRRVQINRLAVDAFTALSQALLQTGYQAHRTGGYCCRA